MDLFQHKGDSLLTLVNLLGPDKLQSFISSVFERICNNIAAK
jgi:hypothetical protein